jgi:hypothetical protein
MPMPPGSVGVYVRTMTSTRPPIAAVILTLSGLLVGIAAAAIGIASLVVPAGPDADPSGVRLLDDLVAVLPFIVAFVGIDLAAAFGLARGRAWAIEVGSVLALGAVAMGTIGLLILVLGNDPSMLTAATRSAETDGVGFVGAFTGLNVAALLAIRLRTPSAPSLLPVAA